MKYYKYKDDNSVQYIKKGSFKEMNSEKLLVSHNTWNLQTVSGFKFYFDLSVPENDRAQIINKVVESYSDVIEGMDRQFSTRSNRNGKLIFWVFSDKEQKFRLTKNKNRIHTVAEYNSVYTYYDRSLLYEEIELLESTY